MFILQSDIQNADHYSEAARVLSAELVSELNPLESGFVLPTGRTLDSVSNFAEKVFLIKDGALKVTVDDQLLYFFGEGDLVTSEIIAGNSGSVVFAEFAVVLDVFSKSDFFQLLQSTQEKLSKWMEYQGLCLTWMANLLSHHTSEGALFSPEVLVIQEGEVIIEEGISGDRVFTLLEGRASVSVEGVKVGEILTEELFGAVSALTANPRIATVTADTDCMVVSMSKEQFLNLVKDRPDTMLKFAEDLSRAIVSLNEKVLSAEKEVVA
jgi:hypothetical protein